MRSSKMAIVTLPVIVEMNSWVQSTLTPQALTSHGQLYCNSITERSNLKLTQVPMSL